MNIEVLVREVGVEAVECLLVGLEQKADEQVHHGRHILKQHSSDIQAKKQQMYDACLHLNDACATYGQYLDISNELTRYCARKAQGE